MIKNQFYDIFLGKRSERIIKAAKKKGWDSVVFLKNISSFQGYKKIKERLDNYDGIFLEVNKLEEVRKIFQNYRGFLVIAGSSDSFNRQLCNMKISGIVNPEREVKKDYLHYRNSGFNHVTAKLCKEKEILLITNFLELRSKNKKERSQQIGRLMQNLRLARKFKTKYAIASFAKTQKQIINIKGIKEFLNNLNLSLGEQSKALKNIYLKTIEA